MPRFRNSEINQTSINSVRNIKKLQTHHFEFNATLNSNNKNLKKLLLYSEALNIIGTDHLADGPTSK
jgi:sulfatase maturation enzyme AslB (radical SAM superfamily)